MPEAKTFVLDIETDPSARTASLALSDGDGKPIAESDLRLDNQPASMWEALFDTPGYVFRHARAAGRHDDGPPVASVEAEIVEQIGVFVGNQVMGPAILGAISAGGDMRSLLVRVKSRAPALEGAADLDPLASMMSRVPWATARGALGSRSLLERSVITRVGPHLPASLANSKRGLSIERGEPVRVLCVFAEGKGGRPLAARLSRERLSDLFFDEIMPEKKVTLDVLCHGVTRERLRRQIEDAGGYHLIHWIGHGRARGGRSGAAGGGSINASLDGADLAEILGETSVAVPRLVFLGAEDEGPLGSIADWGALREALLSGPASASFVERPALAAIFEQPDPRGKAAMDLLSAGVRQVVLSRHPAGSAYLRRLSRRFYRALLAGPIPERADSALALAQRELFADKRTAEYDAADHASVVLLGERSQRFDVERGRSPDLELRKPKPQPLLRGRADLEPPRGLSGRGAELSTLHAKWLSLGGAAVALLHGGPGVGKTSLAAEAIHLWHRRFEWVIAFAARKPGLLIEEFYRELDKRLMRISPAYCERCRENEELRVYLPPRHDLTGSERHEVLRDNLIDVLRSSSVFLVIDGFEENLAPVPVEEGHLAGDPEWDSLLRALAARLSGAAGSRVLLTSRHPVASLAGGEAVTLVNVGPLLAWEALSLFEEAPPLRALIRGDHRDRELAFRALELSGGHPPALQRLCDLAREGRAVLDGALSSPAPVAQGAPARMPSIPPPASVRGLFGSDAAPPSIRTGPASRRPMIAYPTGSADDAVASSPTPSIPPPSRDPSAPPSFAPPPISRIGAEESAAALAAATTPEKVAQRAVAMLIERLSPAARSLLWRMARAPAPASMDLIQRVSEIA